MEDERPELLERLNRLKRQHEWGDLSDGDYLKKRQEIRSALDELKVPEVSAIIDAGDYLQNVASVWKEATEEDRRDMTRAILEEVICDPEQRRLVALRRKPSFALVFRHIPGLVTRDGLFEILESP